MRVLRTAAFWSLDYIYALRGLTAAALPGSGPEGYAAVDGDRARRPLVIVPGVYETWQFLRPLIRRLHDAGHPVHVISDLGRNAGSVPEAGALLAKLVSDRDLRDVTIIAHSKGGLIGKYAMALLDPGDRIRDMIAIATPFSGSRYATYLPIPSLHAFAPTDPTTRLLVGQTAVNPRITSIYADFDPHIPGGSAVDAAVNIRIPEIGHFRILATSALWEAVEGALHGDSPH
jgi:triacylglycerol lipase